MGLLFASEQGHLGGWADYPVTTTLLQRFPY
jgi:hypothetical protein